MAPVNKPNQFQRFSGAHAFLSLIYPVLQLFLKENNSISFFSFKRRE